MVFKGRVNMLANSCLDGINMPSRLRSAGLDLPAQIDRGCVNILPRLGGTGLNLLAQIPANLGSARLDLPAQTSGAGLDFLAQFLANFIQRRVARVPVHSS